jgi:hypothetical protein
MYSNFITPPDFVEEDFHTVTCIDISDDDLLLLGKACQNINISYNVYLYKSSMNDDNWLQKAISRSKNIIVNLDNEENIKYCQFDNAYCYGHEAFLCPAVFIDNPLIYFQHVENENK